LLQIFSINNLADTIMCREENFMSRDGDEIRNTASKISTAAGTAFTEVRDLASIAESCNVTSPRMISLAEQIRQIAIQAGACQDEMNQVIQQMFAYADQLDQAHGG
jgi:hypothetical protein